MCGVKASVAAGHGASLHKPLEVGQRSTAGFMLLSFSKLDVCPVSWRPWFPLYPLLFSEKLDELPLSLKQVLG